MDQGARHVDEVQQADGQRAGGECWDWVTRCCLDASLCGVPLGWTAQCTPTLMVGLLERGW